MSELEDKRNTLQDEISKYELRIEEMKSELRRKKNDIKAIDAAIEVMKGTTKEDDEKDTDVGLALPIVC